jgi:filamin
MNAGAGALAVTVDGPSKVQLDCREVAEGINLVFFFINKISINYSL